MEWDFDTWLKVAGITGAVVTGISGVYQYNQAQLWMRTEWVVKEMKEFQADPYVKDVFLMLDWDKIELQEVGLVMDELVVAALQTHDIKKKFTRTEASIRHRFDYFLDKVAVFGSTVSSGLLTDEFYEVYLGYWGRRISIQRPIPGSATNRFEQLKAYASFYGYRATYDFLVRLGRLQTPFY